VDSRSQTSEYRSWNHTLKVTTTPRGATGDSHASAAFAVDAGWIDEAIRLRVTSGEETRLVF
jgi:hypothetical protein